MKKMTTALSVVAMMAMGAQAATLEERVQVLEEQNSVLAEEVLATQTGGFTLVDTEKSYSGMGPAASKVYFSKNPLSIGGYGEMFYANPDNGDDYADVYRFITYFGYKFNDWIVLNTEIEFEHGADSNNGGKVVVEFFYLDFLLSQEANLRLGHVLVPMGLVNLRHEPTLFNTVQRPDIEKHLLPSTWHENGALVYGRFDSADIDYTVGMINALNLNSQYTIGDDTQSKWIREGRLGASKDASFEPAFVGRVDYTGINGLMVGASLYYGEGSNLKNPKPEDAIQDVSGLTTTMFDIHASYDNGPFSIYGLYTQTNLDGAEKLGESAVEKASGYYVNASYDLSGLVGLQYKLPVFAQYEEYNPVENTVDGSNEDTFQTEIVTIGLNFFPADQVVLKADYAMKEVNNVDTNTFSFGLGFIF
ncbi:MAG TPA: porin [Sulfurovum sp.]|uniref:porin n=1 Tax=Sulfurovum sp. TaxID=1969726 RepID=UPI002F926D19